MGIAFSKLFAKLKGSKKVRLVLLGLDAAGKTTILYMLKFGELVTTIPTIGFNMESIEYKNVRLDCWDAGGQEAYRSFWRHYCQECQGVLYVVDSSDVERLEEARDELHRIIRETSLQKAAILVIANKQDMKDAVPVDIISKQLALDRIQQPHRIQPTVATSGDGLVEGLDWLIDQIKQSQSSLTDSKTKSVLL